MPTQRHGQHSGFTLIELLVSTVILAVGLVALSQLYITALWTTKNARYTEIAVARAQQELESAQASGSKSYASFIGTTKNVRTSSMDTLPRGSCKVETSPVSGKDNLATITITISWRNASGKDTSFRITSYITPVGAQT